MTDLSGTVPLMRFPRDQKLAPANSGMAHRQWVQRREAPLYPWEEIISTSAISPKGLLNG